MQLRRIWEEPDSYVAIELLPLVTNSCAVADIDARQYLPLWPHVRVDHNGHQLFKRDFRLPSQRAFGLRGIADEEVELSGATIAWIDLHVLLLVHTEMAECTVEKFSRRMGLTRRDHIVVRLFGFQHRPHACT